MNSFVSGFFVICVLISSITTSLSAEDVGGSEHQTTSAGLSQAASDVEQTSARDDANVGRSMPQNGDARSRNAKPLRNIVMGIYKNYKSTYLGNKTLTEYKQTLRETLRNKQILQQQLNDSVEIEQEDAAEIQQPPDNDEDEEAVVTDAPDDVIELATTILPDHELDVPRRKRKQTQSVPQNLATADNEPLAVAQEEHYHVGPALNMSLDVANSIVKVNLDGESLKELVTGRWLHDNSEEGRGKKYEMVTRILPLFILPFLIQSAIVPFLVTKLKLLLMKSMLVGKLAIFLLIISAFRNGNKMMQTYEVAPSYWASEPSRRSEMAAAASSMAYNGYRVEGKPAAWIN